ncbi:MAG TPA: electron transfer flavoprotein subunit alpha/FixB family protein [Streptosporangiaceae bacterium]|nr:electron transfer flavoprotein subunit alpha/FixB family protein [Streptosporangiaceae bacterium]
MTVLCLVEPDATAGAGLADASLRALALAGRLAESGGESLAAALAGEPTPDQLAALGSAGVTDVHAITSPRLSGYAPAAFGRSIAGLLPVAAPAAIIAAATDHGSEVMAHLGAIIGLDLVANCVEATWSDAGGCALVRYRWAGSLLEDAVLDTSPALLTVATDAPGSAPTVAAGGAPKVHQFEPELADSDLLAEATESAVGGGAVSLATARVVVGGGRGVGGPEGFAPLEELADLLGGVVGVSRVVTSQGWRPHRQQVGQTGTKIAPELYLACGISGAIQHMAGCQAAKHLVAINTDPDAPIMSRADYAVIGDLSQIIPALVAAIRARS